MAAADGVGKSNSASPGAALAAWVRARGGYVNPNVDLYHTLPNGDRGVFALADIAEGEQLMLVPADITLHLPSQQELSSAPAGSYGAAAEHLAKNHPGMSSFIGGVLLLMAEMAKGPSSPFHAYLQALPESCDCLLSWSEEDKAELKGTSLEDTSAQTATQQAFEKEVMPKISGRPDLWPAPQFTSFDTFVRVAGLVQSRAFHLVAENWVLGTKQEGADLFLIPGIDMINHSTDPDRRNTSLSKVNSSMEVEVDGVKRAFTGFFTMKAEKAIAGGQQILHTYGDLSDAQLLQTYGFIDFNGEQPGAGSADDAEEEEGKHKHKHHHKKRKGAGGSAQEDKAAGDLPSFANPYNHVLIPFKTVLEVAREVLQGMAEEDEADELVALEAQKVEFLSGPARLLQAASPRETEFVVTRGKPLTDELLTTVQVLLLMEEEFKELRQDWKEQQKEQKGKEEGEQAQPLLLGDTIMADDIDFANMVSLIIIRVVEVCMERYPTSVKDDVRLLRTLTRQQQLAAQRRRLSVLVRLGEKDLLQLVKREAAMLALRMAQAAAERQRQRKQKGKGAAKGKKAAAADEDDDDEDVSEEVEEDDEDDDDEGEDDDEDDEEEYEDEDEDEEDDDEEDEGAAAPSRKRGRGSKQAESGDDDDDEEDDDQLLDSDDSDKVGYGAEEFDDGPGEAHDRLKAHPAPKPKKK